MTQESLCNTCVACIEKIKSPHCNCLRVKSLESFFEIWDVDTKSRRVVQVAVDPFWPRQCGSQKALEIGSNQFTAARLTYRCHFSDAHSSWKVFLHDNAPLSQISYQIGSVSVERFLLPFWAAYSEVVFLHSYSPHRSQHGHHKEFPQFLRDLQLQHKNLFFRNFTVLRGTFTLPFLAA